MQQKTKPVIINPLLFSVLALFVLFIPVSCVPADSANLIESLLKNTEGGEMTFVTSEGETFTVTIAKTGKAAADNETTANTPAKTSKPAAATVKPVTSATVKPTSASRLADYLPCVNSIEDVFKTLGAWEEAARLQKLGLTWAQIAAELGYDKESMYARILELNQEKLAKAKELGLIDQSTYEYKIKLYGDQGLKYIGKIFAP